MHNDTHLAQRLSRKGRPVNTVAKTLRGIVALVSTQAARPVRPDAGVNDIVDLPDLMSFQAVIDAAEEALWECANRLHDEGHSWTEIGRALGVTRQAALKRFGPASRR